MNCAKIVLNQIINQKQQRHCPSLDLEPEYMQHFAQCSSD